MTETAKVRIEGLGTDDAASRVEQQKLRLDFLNAFHVAFKGARFFPPQNGSVIRKIHELLEFIQRVFETEGACNLEHVHGSLMLNAARLKTDVAGLVPYNFVMETFTKLRTGSIQFDAGITFEDLRNFLYVFAKIDPRDSGDDPFKMLEEGVKRPGLTGVTVGPEDDRSLAMRNDDLRRHSVDIYFRSISVAKSILQNAHAGKAVNFRHAKRAVQQMVDIAMEDEFFLLALSSIKNYDEYTYNHSSNVAVLAITFGQHLGLDKKLLGALGMAALLHDIGKTDIDKEVLNKSGKLSRDEWDMLKSHPMLGVKRLLRSGEMNELLMRAIVVAFQHHKRVDLQGYPETPSERELNLFSRIVAIADCYDALTTPRVYRSRSYSAAEAFDIMLDDSGTVFDPTLLNEFALFLSLYPVGTVLQLDTGESALVYRVRHDIEVLDRPTVKVVADPAGNRVEPFVADLNERNPDGTFKRNVVCVVAPSKYFENLEEYFAML
ncbi:MAG TPA: HD-GYP domain-containing protein [Planctomycetota bacterium]|nr:HD-GYP domain-containing protein [Planctomycetota bacterium]